MAAMSSKWGLGARNRLCVDPPDMNSKDTFEFLALSSEPLGKDEALSEHYLDLINGPPPTCTRTRARSHAGPPPEWMRGAHGECVQLKSSSSTEGRYPARRRRKAAKSKPEVADEEGSAKDYFAAAADAITEKVNPLCLEMANALVTLLGLSGHQDVSNMSDEIQQKAVEELMRMAKEAEVDPFEGIEALQAVLFRAGYSIPEVAVVIQNMRVHLVRLAFEEYTGGGCQLENMMKMCEEVREMVSRSEFIVNAFLVKTRTGGYESLIQRIESTDGLPNGVEETQEKVLISIADFHSELLQFGTLLWKNMRYEKQIARETFEQVREEALAEKRAEYCEQVNKDFHSKREEWKARLEEKYAAFHNAHAQVREEINKLQKACIEQEASNLKHEEDVDEWQRRLNLLREHKERRDGTMSGQDKVLEENIKDTRRQLQLKDGEMEFINGEIADLKRDIEARHQDLENFLVVVCAKEWYDKLVMHSTRAAERRETSAFTVEDLLVARLKLTQQLDNERLKQTVREKRKELTEQKELNVVWRSRLTHCAHEQEVALENMKIAQQWLHDHGLLWIVNNTTGKIIYEAPLTTPRHLRHIFEMLMTRVARRRHCMQQWFHSNARSTSECPAGICQKAAEAVCDLRRAACIAPSDTRWRVCLVSSSSEPAILVSLDGSVAASKCMPSAYRMGFRSLVWQYVNLRMNSDLRSNRRGSGLSRSGSRRGSSKEANRRGSGPATSRKPSLGVSLETLIGGGSRRASKERSSSRGPSRQNSLSAIDKIFGDGRPGLPRHRRSEGPRASDLQAVGNHLRQSYANSLSILSDLLNPQQAGPDAEQVSFKWHAMQDRWRALLASARELCRGDIAFMGDIGHVRNTTIPRPWNRQMLHRLQAVIADGFSCVACLQRLESVLTHAQNLQMNDLVIKLGESEEDMSDFLDNALLRTWTTIAEKAAACEERQRSVAVVVSNFEDIQSRVEALAAEVSLLGSQAEDFGFTARMLRATKRTGDDRTPATLHEQQKATRFVAICLTDEARRLRAEQIALLDFGGSVYSMEKAPLCTEELQLEPRRFLNMVMNGLQARAKNVKLKLGALSRGQAIIRRGSAHPHFEENVTFGELDDIIDIEGKEKLEEELLEKPAAVDKAMLMKFNKAIGKMGLGFQLKQSGDDGQVVVSTDKQKRTSTGEAGRRSTGLGRRFTKEAGSPSAKESEPQTPRREMKKTNSKQFSKQLSRDFKSLKASMHEPPPLPMDSMHIGGDGQLEDHDTAMEDLPMSATPSGGQSHTTAKVQSGGNKVRSLIYLQRAVKTATTQKDEKQSGHRATVSPQKLARQSTASPEGQPVLPAEDKDKDRSPSRVSVKRMSSERKKSRAAMRRASSHNSVASLESSESVDSALSNSALSSPEPSRLQTHKERASPPRGPKEDTVAMVGIRGRSLAVQPASPVRKTLSTDAKKSTQGEKREGALSPQLLEMLQQPQGSSMPPRHQVSRDREGGESSAADDGTVHLSSSLADDDSISDEKAVLPKPATPDVSVVVKKAVPASSHGKGRNFLHTHVVEGDTILREMSSNHLEPLLLPWVKADPATLLVGGDTDEPQNVDIGALNVAGPTPCPPAAQIALPDFAPREPLEQPAGWGRLAEHAEDASASADTATDPERDQDLHFDTELQDSPQPSMAATGVRQATGRRVRRPSSAGQPSAGEPSAEQEAIDFDDVDVPLNMPEIGHTPSWILDMVRQVQSATPSRDTPSFLTHSTMQAGDAPMPSPSADMYDAPSVASTPLPPPLAYGSHMFGSPSPTSADSRKTPCLIGGRQSRNMWLPTFGADAHKACASKMSASLSRKLGGDATDRSLSPERADSRERSARQRAVPTPRRPCTAEPGQLPRWQERSSPTEQSAVGFAASFGGSSAARVPPSLPDERPPSGMMTRPQSSARGRTPGAAQEPTHPLPWIAQMTESARASPVDLAAQSVGSARISSNSANWLPTTNREAGRNVDSALSMASNDQDPSQKRGTVHVLARGMCGQLKKGVKVGARPHPSPAIQERRPSHSRNSIVRASQYV